jgi:catechol 2,3-dioxygenase-like lactoylglutathione lyase family enzyme
LEADVDVIPRIHHVQVTIPTGEEDRARRFYCGVLGLNEIVKPSSLEGRGGFWLQVGDQELHVGTEDGVARHNTTAHIAFQVDDATTWRQRIAESGCVPLPSIVIPGFDRFEFRDPFWNRLEIIQAIEGRGERRVEP